MIEKMNTHYSFTNPASVHDEEALTALELAGRQGAKINEVIDDQNDLRMTTLDRLSQQDSAIENEKNITIPNRINQKISEYINNGTFDNAINEYAGDIENRINNIIGAVSEGSTTLDAEVIDMRSGHDDKTYSSAGDALRKMTDAVQRPIALDYNYVQAYATQVVFNRGHLFEMSCIPTHPNHFILLSADIEPGVMYRAIIKTSEGSRATKLIINNIANYTSTKGFVTTVHRHVENGNLVIFDFSFTNTSGETPLIGIRFESPANTNCSFSASVIKNVGLSEVFAVDTENMFNGFNSPIPFYYINTVNAIPSEFIIVNGDYSPTLEITPTHYALAIGLFCQLNVGETYLLRMKTIAELRAIYYNTATSWGVGSFANIESKIIQVNEGYEIYIKVLDNSVDANRITMRLDYPENLPYTVKCELQRVFNYSFENDETPTEYIAFIGDSLTAQGYYGYIQSEETKIVFAVGGEGISPIFARTGVDPLYVESKSILPGRNPIQLSFNGLFQQGMGSINPVSIAGITGTLELAENTYYFTPSAEIEETPVFRPLVIPNQCKLNIVRYVFWVGTNNGTWTAQQIFNEWEKILKVYPNSLILGLTADHTEERVNLVRDLDTLGTKFGSRYVPLHDWLVNYGLSYCGLTPTSEDTAAVASGKIPPSLLNDAVHFNESGKRAVAHLVAERLKIKEVV